MDAISAAVISTGMQHQARQLEAETALTRSAQKSDAAVLQLLDAAKALEPASSGAATTSRGSGAAGKGAFVNFVA